MPKVSKATASSHQPIPGMLDAYSHELDGWTVSMETHPIDLDAAFLFKGAPNDQCQAPHMGYVLKGKYGMRTADGVEEVYEAGDAFFVGPGHTPITFAGCEIVYFTRTEEANRELPVAAANMMNHHSRARIRRNTGSVGGPGRPRLAALVRGSGPHDPSETAQRLARRTWTARSAAATVGTAVLTATLVTSALTPPRPR